MPSGNELELTGTVTFGLADEVRTMLRAHPGITTLRLNSHGGRVGPARKLRDLISERDLATHTSDQCLSACVIAYIGGTKRTIALGAQIRVHQYSFPGMTKVDLQREYAKDRRDFELRGVTANFIDRAFERPPENMWFPTPVGLASNLSPRWLARFCVCLP